MSTRAIFSLAGIIVVVASLAWAQEIPVAVQLTGPLSVSSAHRGDLITAQVSSPDSLKGDTLRCTVTQVNNARGQAVVEFTVDALHHSSGVDIPVTANVQGVSNSKGQPGVDEQGRSVHAVYVPAKAPTQARVGSRLGGALGGRLGQAVSQVPDSNTPGSPAAIQMAAQGPDLQLGPGSTIMFTVRSTGSVNLASIASGPPPAGNMSMNPAPAPPSAPAMATTTAATPQPSAAGQPAAAGAAGGQPELKATKIEFVPGERTVFFEDFSDMAEGEPPPHWKVRNGTVELRTGGGIRELYSEKGVQLTSESFAGPANFTLEVDWTGGGQMVWYFKDKNNDNVIWTVVRGEPDGKTASTSVAAAAAGELGSGQIQTDTSVPVHFALWVQQGRVRAFMNGERLVDVNQVATGPTDHILLDFAGYRPNGLRQVRIAESAPDFSTVINASGKYVTHGINFDTDSDRLKTESSAMLKQVAAALQKNPNLKLEIDGYTDSVGNPAHNLDLSKRRAQAVQSVLVAQFGVDAARLSANGFGADQPIGSNDTPDGRAQNRRVEFLKK